MTEPLADPRYDRREANQAFFHSVLARVDSFDIRLRKAEKDLSEISRGVWCLVKTLRYIGLGLFAAVVAILPEYGRSRGWW